jgi:hypothetical protein
MPVELALWRIDGELRPIVPASFEHEARLEQFVIKDLSLLGLDLLILGTQIETDFGTRIDVLGIDVEGTVYIIELKRDRTPREVVAQVLDYGSWATRLSNENIRALFEERTKKPFDAAFSEQFGSEPPDALNEEHRLVIVASSLDPTTERIIAYLSQEYGVPLNAVFFRYFRDGTQEYLARAWLIDPNAAEAQASRAQGSKATKEPWNGKDFYVSFGAGRSWEEARRFGYISGGGGRWYSQTLSQLAPGARVFVNVPPKRYVGVGIVKDRATPIQEFLVTANGKTVPFLEAAPDKSGLHANSDPDKNEYMVRVEWLKTVPLDEAIWETGMFGSQHTACKMRHKFTLQRLTERFGIEE